MFELLLVICGNLASVTIKNRGEFLTLKKSKKSKFPLAHNKFVSCDENLNWLKINSSDEMKILIGEIRSK